MIIVGIDPGFAALGIAVLELLPRSTRVLHHETFTTRSVDDDGDRLDSIAERLLDVLDQYEAVAVGYESQAWADVAARQQALAKREQDDSTIGISASSRHLHEVVGIIRCVARAFDVPCYCLMPSTVKCAVLGKGGSRADKAKVKERVRLMFALGRCSEHVADAVAIAVGAGVRHRRHVVTTAQHASLIH